MVISMLDPLFAWTKNAETVTRVAQALPHVFIFMALSAISGSFYPPLRLPMRFWSTLTLVTSYATSYVWYIMEPGDIRDRIRYLAIIQYISIIIMAALMANRSNTGDLEGDIDPTLTPSQAASKEAQG